jgi:hypothetical protein
MTPTPRDGAYPSLLDALDYLELLVGPIAFCWRSNAG